MVHIEFTIDQDCALFDLTFDIPVKNRIGQDNIGGLVCRSNRQVEAVVGLGE
jgi:hypothetical protein